MRLNTLDDNLVTIPNSQFMNNYVASGNAGELGMMIVCKVHTKLDVDIFYIKSFMYEIIATSKYVYLNKPIVININEVEIGFNLAICFTMKAYVLDVKYEKAFETDIMTRVLNEMNKREISRPSSI